MPEFFLELFSEEMPAREQLIAAEALNGVVSSMSMSLDLDAAYDETLTSFCSPRRIAVTGILPAEKKASVAEIRGPREGAPKIALDGFLSKHHGRREDVVIENGFHILRRLLPAVSARAFVEAKLPEYLSTQLCWSKSMRWGQSGDFTWIRPLRRIVCLLDGEIVPLTLGPVTASDKTEGHRVLGSGVFAVSSAKDWVEQLKANHVIPDYHERLEIIQCDMREKAAKLGLIVAQDESLLGEVTNLVEWPVPLIGRIDSQFMGLPPEVRELSMKVNQKYFALRDAAGNPAPYFAFVANLAAPDGGAAIIAGNERVLRARLSDARYFWELDLSLPLDQLLPKLDAIVFHAKLGSQGERAQRISKLAKQIAAAMHANEPDCAQAEWAGLLCKVDLVTSMVGEFPELQGIMGGYYADWLTHGWDGDVVGPAIRTHYQPKGPNDPVPTGTVAISVALADKLDTLIQFFGIGETPTGSGDPYALRRAALGVIRIILENNLRLPLKPLLQGDATLFGFIIERLRVKLRGEGKRHDVLDAVLAAGADDDLVRVMKRVDALGEMLGTDDGKNLLAAYRRAGNILKIEAARDDDFKGVANPGLLAQDEERKLADLLDELNQPLADDLKNDDFTAMMAKLAAFRGPLDEFFQHVTVNADAPELRRNRLRLLSNFIGTVDHVADFSKIAA